MSNPMHIKDEIKHIADKYQFHWRAKLTDGSIIRQFDEDGAHSFQQVQDNEDSLVYFWLELQNTPSPLLVGVNLVDGSFNINEFTLESLKDDIPWKEIVPHPEFRIINFRRIRKNFTLGHSIEDAGGEMEYFIGWQTTHEGKNYKKLLKIGANGEFSVS